MGCSHFSLAYVYPGKGKERVLVNREIIAQGYGHVYTKYPFNRDKVEDFRKAEREAREGKRGLWADAKAEAKVDGKAEAKEKEKKPEHAAPKTVYVTPTGKKYHADGCRFLARSKSELTPKQAKKGFTPCSVCKPPK